MDLTFLNLSRTYTTCVKAIVDTVNMSNIVFWHKEYFLLLKSVI